MHITFLSMKCKPLKSILALNRALLTKFLGRKSDVQMSKNKSKNREKPQKLKKSAQKNFASLRTLSFRLREWSPYQNGLFFGKRPLIPPLIHVYVMIFLLKRRLCIKIDFYDNSQVLDFYDYESHKIIQINHFLIFTWSKKSLLDFYS